MRTVVVGPRPAELERLIARRQQLGQDLFDEVWEGEYHMAPAPHPRHGLVLDELVAAIRDAAHRSHLRPIAPFNLGEVGDYRVPDYGYLRDVTDDTYVPTAAIVVEVVSPDDETFDKFAFYARHDVDEIVTVEPLERRIRWWVRRDSSGYDETTHSPRLDVTVAALTAQIDWP